MACVRICVCALGLWACVSAAAEPRIAVQLRHGFTLEAEAAEWRGDFLVLRVDGGELRLAREDVQAMEALTGYAEAASPANPAAASEQPRQLDVPELLRDAAARHGLPEAFVRSVAQAESGLQPAAVSPKGALGVMQLMPSTAAALGVDPQDPAANIEGGVRLLRTLLLQYQNYPDQVRRALAAYNAGQGAVQRHNGVPPYRETQVYVERVLSRYRRQSTVEPPR
jgi:soluble lytic murein transglycosylase-like protein